MRNICSLACLDASFHCSKLEGRCYGTNSLIVSPLFSLIPELDPNLVSQVSYQPLTFWCLLDNTSSSLFNKFGPSLSSFLLTTPTTTQHTTPDRPLFTYLLLLLKPRGLSNSLEALIKHILVVQSITTCYSNCLTTMAPSPHSSRAAIVNRMSPSGKLSAYNIRPSGINQNVSSGKLSAYSTPSVAANQNISSGKLSAYDLRSATKNQNGSSGKLSAYDIGSFTMEQIGSPVKLSAYSPLPADLGNLNSSGKLSAYSTQPATTKRTTPSGKLSAYDAPSTKRSKWIDSLQMGQYSISFDDECLDDDCSNFCKNSEGKLTTETHHSSSNTNM